jgi:hypothetical protein
VIAHSVYPSQQQWGNKIGSSIVFEDVQNPKTQKWVERFISKTNFTGQIGFDFIETADGMLYAIECNPRATSGIHLFNEAPELVERFLHGENTMVVVPKGDEIRSVKFWLAVRLIRLIFSFRPVREWKETWRLLRRSNDVLYEKGDPGPVVGHMISLAEALFRCVRFGICPAEITLHDCNYNGIDESTEQISRKLKQERERYQSDLKFD